MKLQEFTISLLLVGLLVFYGYGAFSQKWQEYSVWDEVFAIWLKLTDVMFVLCFIYEDTRWTKRIWKTTLWVLIPRFVWQTFYSSCSKIVSPYCYEVVQFVFFILTLIIICLLMFSPQKKWQR